VASAFIDWVLRRETSNWNHILNDTTFLDSLWQAPGASWYSTTSMVANAALLPRSQYLSHSLSGLVHVLICRKLSFCSSVSHRWGIIDVAGHGLPPTSDIERFFSRAMIALTRDSQYSP